jgi:hypothetical protein
MLKSCHERAAKNFAAANALAHVAAMRKCKVPKPRSTNQHSNGAAISPHTELTSGTRSQADSLPHSRPKSASLWPFIILVRLSITKSAPNSSGRQIKGDAKVLSTNSFAPPR